MQMADILTCVRCWKELCGNAQIEGVWQDSWQALEHLVGSGKIHSIGLSHSFLTVSSAQSCVWSLVSHVMYKAAGRRTKW